MPPDATMVDSLFWLVGVVYLLSIGFVFGQWAERRRVCTSLLQAHRIHAPVLIERGAYHLVQCPSWAGVLGTIEGGPCRDCEARFLAEVGG